MSKKKEVSRIEQLKSEFISYAKKQGKEINEESFWKSGNGLMLGFIFEQIERIEGNNESLESLINEISKGADYDN